MQVMPNIGTHIKLPVAGMCEVSFISNNQTYLLADDEKTYVIPNNLMSRYYAVVKGDLK